jgi:hypothetical protein
MDDSRNWPTAESEVLVLPNLAKVLISAKPPATDLFIADAMGCFRPDPAVACLLLLETDKEVCWPDLASDLTEAIGSFRYSWG